MFIYEFENVDSTKQERNDLMWSLITIIAGKIDSNVYSKLPDNLKKFYKIKGEGGTYAKTVE